MDLYLSFEVIKIDKKEIHVQIDLTGFDEWTKESKSYLSSQMTDNNIQIMGSLIYLFDGEKWDNVDVWLSRPNKVEWSKFKYVKTDKSYGAWLDSVINHTNFNIANIFDGEDPNIDLLNLLEAKLNEKVLKYPFVEYIGN